MNKFLDKALSVFAPEIKALKAGETAGERNVIIGGSVALMLHGLQIGREPGDLDLVIYTPTDRQMIVLSDSRTFKNAEESGEYGGYKCAKEGRVLNVLIEVNKPVPSGLLGGMFTGYSHLIQSIDNVMAAKTRYARPKDFYDLQQLKNLNFNSPQPADAVVRVLAEDGYPESEETTIASTQGELPIKLGNACLCGKDAWVARGKDAWQCSSCGEINPWEPGTNGRVPLETFVPKELAKIQEAPKRTRKTKTHSETVRDIAHGIDEDKDLFGNAKAASYGVCCENCGSDMWKPIHNGVRTDLAECMDCKAVQSVL